MSRPRVPVPDVAAYDEDRARETRRREADYLRLLTDAQRRGALGPGGRPRDGKQPTTSPFLVIPYSLADVGVRPIPPGNAFWASPYVTVSVGGAAVANPVAGIPNTISTTVFNLGSFQAEPLQVDFYWTDPSLGLVPSSMQHIGRAWATVGSLSHVDVTCPEAWTPVVVNGGHECLIVQCSNWILDPLVAAFNPVADRHVAQRNVQVVSLAPAKSWTTPLRVANLFPFATRVEVTATAHLMVFAERPAAAEVLALWSQASARPTDATAFRRGTRGHAQAVADARRRRRNPENGSGEVAVMIRPADVAVAATLREGSLEDASNESDLALAAQLLEALRGVVSKGPADRPVLVTELPARTSSTVDVEAVMPAELGPREAVVVELTQRIGELTLGGYTIVLLPE